MAQPISLQHTTVVVNKHTVKGWSNDTDALMMPPDFEVNTVTRGADGNMVVSRTGPQGGEVRLKLMAGSASHKFFMQLGSQIKGTINSPGARVRFDGTVTDSNAGWSASLVDGALTRFPLAPSIGQGGPNAQEFVFEFEDIQPNFDNANFGLAPAS